MKLCVFWFRGELGFLNCDDICMCVVNKQFELLELVFDSVYVDLQYDEISLTFTAGSVCSCGVCCSPVVVLWGVCEVVVVPYVVGAVVAVTVMHVLLFVLHMCMLRECECARVTEMLVWVRGRCGCGECVYRWYTWFRCFV